MVKAAVGKIALPVLLALLTLSIISVVNQPATGPSQPETNTSTLKTFTSLQELRRFVLEAQKLHPKHWPPLDVIQPSVGGAVTSLDRAFNPTQTQPETLRYSKTNIQVPGVDEDDIVKTDGAYIYLARGHKIIIVRAYPPAEAGLQSTVHASGHITGLYVNHDRLVVMSSSGFKIMPFVRCVGCFIPPVVAVNTTVQVFDVSDRANPVEIRKAAVSGWLVASRMVDAYVYIITSEPVMITAESQDGVTLPSYSVDGTIYRVEPTMIYHDDVPDQAYTYTNILAVNVKDQREEVAVTTVMTPASGAVYVSKQNIYIASPNWMDGGETTSIHRLRFKGRNVTPEAAGNVPGYLLNQFSLDEHMEYLRVATTFLERQSKTVNGPASPSRPARTVNGLYVLDMSLRVVGKVENLAPGERIYSVRFMGGKAYLVTFKKVDPLFVVELENPVEPRVLGQLKIPGYSSYLHPYDDTHLIGLGKDAKPAEEGDFACFQGLKISLFDVSDYTNPKELDTLILGDRGTESEALHNHKAFLFDRERNLMVIPVLLALVDTADYGGRPSPNTFGEYVFQGAYAFRISPEDGVKVLGRITHLPDNQDLLKSGEYFTSRYAVKRTLFIDEILYTISDGKIMLNNIDTLEKIAEVRLPTRQTSPPSYAFFSSAISNFFIFRNARVTRPIFSSFFVFIIVSSISGTICQETPNL
ncbi:MAG: beta-propeller domain-containing protein, partial [Candidatus Caldarchaeum sp.]